jgi:hypothetical protein
MRRLIFAALMICIAMPVAAKPKRCLTKSEISSDLIIRHGVFLREASDRCDSYQPGSNDIWKKFDETFGTKLKAERTKRENAFKREFPDTWFQVVTTFDARMVTFDRNLPFTDAFCQDVRDLLEDNQSKGWGNFVKQSKVIRDKATLDFKPCD